MQAHYGGEDACFTALDGKVILAVFDGVGGWKSDKLPEDVVASKQQCNTLGHAWPHCTIKSTKQSRQAHLFKRSRCSCIIMLHL